MLNRSVALLGIQRGTILKLAKSTLARRYLCQETSSSSLGHMNPRAEVPEQYTVDHFKDVLTTEEERKKCHLILLEIASLRDDTGRAPSEIRTRDIEDLLTHSVHQRRKYYEYMFKREMSIRSEEKKKAAARALREETPRTRKEPPDGLFPFIRKRNMYQQTQGKYLAQAALFGQKIIFDFSYDEHMTKREMRNLAEQIQQAFAVNRSHPAPFDFTFCNLKKDTTMMKLLDNYFGVDDFGYLLLGTTEKHYLDLCPKKELIYLSPDSPHALGEWDHSTTFIIGGLVDLGPEKPLSLARAKQEGIATARFPIQETVILKQGAQKTLTLNAVVDILLTMKTENNWRRALEKLPKRFIADYGLSQKIKRRKQQSQLRRESLAKFA